MTKLLAATVAALLACTLTACGGDDDATASKNISASIISSQKSSTGAAQLLSLKKKDADCIGDGLVDKVGTDKLQTYGVLTKDLKAKQSVTEVAMSGADAKAATDVLFGCSDIEAKMRAAVSKAGSIPQAMRGCVDKALASDNLRPMFTKVFEGKQDEAQKALTAPLAKCAAGSAG
jgi:hypothetical protein